ncbi:hypothetical protein NMB0504 [Neisseria meningitidis MC58]|uniref:Uncharacterized protein n=1 Tax=Neisseria meningitidis serogroup B (strain ATCC BAA-335 / MC58) TaxID=122586 RepID=Q9K0S4_NEIMB|nr:hypothetical protein NMB0504 [Neisseria meningitidis MC58]
MPMRTVASCSAPRISVRKTAKSKFNLTVTNITMRDRANSIPLNAAATKLANGTTANTLPKSKNTKTPSPTQ